MITWLIFTLLAPVGTFNIYTCAWCGVLADAFLIGQIYQKIEKVIDKRRK